MTVHAIVHVTLALLYLEASYQSFTEGDRHCAFREIGIALLYACIAFFILDPTILPDVGVA
jgi:hypothetical protein